MGKAEREGMKCVLRSWEEMSHIRRYRPHSRVLPYSKKYREPLTCFKLEAQVNKEYALERALQTREETAGIHDGWAAV